MEHERLGPSGLLVVDKPRGITSHDVVDRARRLLRTRRIGHTGILDPNATGVLPLCVGRATRLAQFLIAESKSYEGVIRLGLATATYDSAGEPLGPAVEPRVTREQAEAALARFRGPILQTPPMFSAKKVGGRKLYELAREGKEVERKPVEIEVYELEMTSFDGERVGFRMRSSSGAYVRNIAHELGAALGCGGHLETLVRTAVGHITLADAVSLDALTPEQARDALLPMEGIPLGMPFVRVTAMGLTKMRHGSPLDRSVILDHDLAEWNAPPSDESGEAAYVRVLDAEGRLLAVAERKAALFFQPRVVLFS